MTDRYDDLDRYRERDRNWDRDRERGRDAGQRFDESRRESRGENHGQGGREYGQYDRERDYGREREGYGSEGRYGGRYGSETSEFGQGSREDWRSSDRGSQTGQALGGGMATYSGQDWRTQRQGRTSGIGEGFGRGRESWGDRGYSEHAGDQGTSWQGTYGTGTYGQTGMGGEYGSESYRGGAYGGQRGYGGQETRGRFTGRGPKGYQRSDERIREDVCERLTQHPEIDASEIEIQVISGEVTLTGTVDDRQQKRLAEDVIENLSGVRDVNNQLRVSKGIGQRVGEALGLSGGRENQDQTAETATAGRQSERSTTRR